MSPAAIIMVTGFLAAGSCALLGCYLVLRRMSMIGDAISHAVLPGIVLAFLVTGSRAPLPMLIGAGAVGFLTAFLIEWLHRSGRIQHDASIGVVFTSLFALGVLLVSQFTGHIDLDTDCVLHGEIAYAPFDVLEVGGRVLGPRPFWILGGVFAVNIAAVLLLYKELKITSFDPVLAAAAGINAALVHYILMGLVSLTTVAAFESVGAILIVAMLIVPAATAYLLTDSLWRMLALSQVFAAVSSVGGYMLARALDASIAGAMVCVSGAAFLLVFCLSPTHGLLARFLRRRPSATTPSG